MLTNADIDLRDAVGVRQDADGYALTKFDLRMFSAALGSPDGLAVTLPAFCGWHSRGSYCSRGLRASISAGHGRAAAGGSRYRCEYCDRRVFGAFASIFIWVVTRTLGEQPCDVAGVSPRLARREFSVERGNARYEAREGSLFDDGGDACRFLLLPTMRRSICLQALSV